jgi:hypothetical protein
MPEALWSLGLFVVGVVLGIALRTKLAGGRARERERELERELDDVRQEHATYRGEVTAHFDRTAELFRDLTHQHAALYRHLAGAARELARRVDGEGDHGDPWRIGGAERPRLPSPDPWTALLSEAARSESAMQPRDVAAPQDPSEQNGSSSAATALRGERATVAPPLAVAAPPPPVAASPSTLAAMHATPPTAHAPQTDAPATASHSQARDAEAPDASVWPDLSVPDEDAPPVGRAAAAAG